MDTDFSETATLTSPDVKSDGDAGDAESALSAIDGVRSVNADPNNHTITVVYNPDVVSMPKLQEALESAGYKISDDTVTTSRSDT